MGPFLRSCTIAATCLFATAAAAQIVRTPVNLPAGAVIDLVIERTTEETGSGVSRKRAGTFHHLLTLTPTEGGYSVTQTRVDAQISPQSQAMLLDPTTAVRTISFETDAGLRPLRIKDRNVVLDEMFGAMRSDYAAIAKPGPEVRAEMQNLLSIRAMLDQLSDDDLAQLLLGQHFDLSQVQSKSMDLSEPLKKVVEFPDPSGGAAFKQTVTARLESYDDATGRAVMFSADEIDPETLKANMLALRRQMSPGVSKDLGRNLENAKLVRRNACRHEIDLKSGLAIGADCTRTVGTLGVDGQVLGRIDHSVITQTVKLP